MLNTGVVISSGVVSSANADDAASTLKVLLLLVDSVSTLETTGVIGAV